jgi:hypothetical protein
MNNDLISRKALREDLRRFFPTDVLEEIEPKTLFAQILRDIDNAPTVEERIDPKDICYICDRKKCGENHNCYECNHTTDIRHAVNFDLVDVPRSIFFERARPYGKWLEDSGNIACSQCHTIWLYRRTDFCPNCGAEMKGGEDHD